MSLFFRLLKTTFTKYFLARHLLHVNIFHDKPIKIIIFENFLTIIYLLSFYSFLLFAKKQFHYFFNKYIFVQRNYTKKNNVKIFMRNSYHILNNVYKWLRYCDSYNYVIYLGSIERLVIHISRILPTNPPKKNLSPLALFYYSH